MSFGINAKQHNGQASGPEVAAMRRAFLGGCKRAALALSLGCIMAVGSIAADTEYETNGAMGPPDLIAGHWISTDAEGHQTTIEPMGKPELIVGRWILAAGDKPQTIDMTKCGEKWCGIEVDTNGKCGRIAFRLTAGNPSQKAFNVQFVGEYSRMEGAEPYAIGAMIWEDKGKVKLAVVGGSGRSFFSLRRAYPVGFSLSREGDAVCKADGKVEEVR